MKEIKGNFWDEAPKYEVLVCTINKTNNLKYHLVMGAGIALEFKNRYPFLPEDWGGQVRTQIREDGYLIESSLCITEHKDKKILVGVPTKNHWKEKSNLRLIESSAYNIQQYFLNRNVNILSPRLGCGMGLLNWEKEVKPIVEKYWDDRFTVISF